MSVKAVSQRMEVINEIVQVWHAEGRIDTRENLEATILTLHDYGRTERWHRAVGRWAAMVRNEDNPLDWAVLQGSIYAVHAAE